MKDGKKRVLLGVTASIAAYKACDIISALKEREFIVRCVMSPGAGHFITPLTLETLSGTKTVHEMFALPDRRAPEHLSLADEADVMLVAPATADMIGKIASGICDDILSCTICAARGPVIIAPAMNDRMWANPVIRDKTDYLISKGYIFVGPVKGRLACGYEGLGRLAPLDAIVEKVEEAVSSKG